MDSILYTNLKGSSLTDDKLSAAAAAAVCTALQYRG